MRELTQPIIASASFVFNRALSYGAKAVLAARNRKNPDDPKRKLWTTLCDSATQPGFLPLISVLGPRWNCHALLIALGPVRVERELACQVGGLRTQAESWSLVLYSPQGDLIVWTGSCRTDAAEVRWELPPGNYTLSLRVYTNASDIDVPSVIVDGVDIGAARRICGERERYAELLESVRGKDGAYFRLLHYYVFYQLSRESMGGSSWLKRHFVPVGNPDTEWQFGHLATGEVLELQRSQLRHANTYITFYNWASFPVSWCQITSATWRSSTFDEPVGYAIRVVRTAPEAQTEIGLVRRHLSAHAAPALVSEMT